MALQKQFKRKDLKKPDLLHALVAKFINYYEKSKWVIIAGALGVVVFAGSIWAYQYNLQAREKRMESLYFKMVKVWAGTKDKSVGNAIKELKAILDKIGDSKVKQRASLLLGDAMYESRNYGQAISIYNRVEVNSKLGDLNFDLARVGLGYSLEANKEYGMAIDVYKSIVNNNTNYPLFYIYLGMARCNFLMGDSENAQLVLREMLNKFPGHSDIAKAQTMLKNVEAPT